MSIFNKTSSSLSKKWVYDDTSFDNTVHYIEQYFKVVSPAFKNTAVNAFLLSANLNFEDS